MKNFLFFLADLNEIPRLLILVFMVCLLGLVVSLFVDSKEEKAKEKSLLKVMNKVGQVEIVIEPLKSDEIKEYLDFCKNGKPISSLNFIVIPDTSEFRLLDTSLLNEELVKVGCFYTTFYTKRNKYEEGYLWTGYVDSGSLRKALKESVN